MSGTLASPRVLAAALGLGVCACAPPPAAWPVGGAQPLPLGAVAVEAYAAAAVDESGGSVPADLGAGAHAHVSDPLTLGAAVGAFRTADAPIGHLRAFGKLHLAGGALAPILGVGAASNFDDATSVTFDAAIAAGVPIGAFELYAAPGIGLGVPISSPPLLTTLYPAFALGTCARLSTRLSLGVEALLSAVAPLESDLGPTWSSGFGLFARYGFGPAAEAPTLF